MANVASSLVMTQDLDTGIACVYERLSSDKMLLVREFPTRADADAYIQHQLDMDTASDRIMEDFRDMAARWINAKAEETGLEPRLVSEWLEGIDLYWTPKECPAESANDQRSEEKVMQDPSAIKVPDYSTPVEPPKPVFPLPADHECDR